MFEGIGSYATMGTMNSFLQQKKLRIAANYKVKTGQRLSDAMRAPSSRDLVESMMKNRRKTEDEASKQRVALIKQKLMSGKRISQTELEYLRDRDTSLYRKAKKAEESREELQARLRNCKTKQEARMAVSQAMVKAAAETGAELAAAKGAAGGGGGAASGALPAAGGQAGPGMEGVSVGAENAAVTEGAASEMPAASAAQETAEMSSSDMAAANGEGTDVSGEAAQVPGEKAAPGGAADGADRNSDAEGKNSAADAAESDNSPDSILEKFIMIIRALEDEWMTFSNSEAYKELPEDMREEAEERDEKKQKPKMRVHEASPQLQRMLCAYRAPKIYEREFALEDLLQRQ